MLKGGRGVKRKIALVLTFSFVLLTPTATHHVKPKGKGWAKILPRHILQIILNNEGGFNDDPRDSGGKTKFGITEYTLNKAIKDKVIAPKEVKDITTEDALKIYDYRYWITCKANLMPEPLNLLHFDTAVLHGNGGATKILQRTLTSMGFPVKIDGGFGPQTMEAFKAALSMYGQEKIIKMYLIKRKIYTQEIHSPRNDWAFNGWMNRLKRMANIIKERYNIG